MSSLITNFMLLAAGVGLCAIAACWRVKGQGHVRFQFFRTTAPQESSIPLLVGTVLWAFGGARAEHRLGWWVYVLAVALIGLANLLPAYVHNQRLSRAEAKESPATKAA